MNAAPARRRSSQFALIRMVLALISACALGAHNLQPAQAAPTSLAGNSGENAASASEDGTHERYLPISEVTLAPLIGTWPQMSICDANESNFGDNNSEIYDQRLASSLYYRSRNERLESSPRLRLQLAVYNATAGAWEYLPNTYYAFSADFATHRVDLRITLPNKPFTIVQLRGNIGDSGDLNSDQCQGQAFRYGIGILDPTIRLSTIVVRFKATHFSRSEWSNLFLRPYDYWDTRAEEIAFYEQEPALIAPPDGAVATRATLARINLRTDMFIWDAHSSGFRLQVDNTGDFASPEIDVQTTDSKHKLTNAELALLQSNMPYYWRVVTLSDAGAPRLFSGARVFSVLENQPENAVTWAGTFQVSYMWSAMHGGGANGPGNPANVDALGNPVTQTFCGQPTAPTGIDELVPGTYEARIIRGASAGSANPGCAHFAYPEGATLNAYWPLVQQSNPRSVFPGTGYRGGSHGANPANPNPGWFPMSAIWVGATPLQGVRYHIEDYDGPQTSATFNVVAGQTVWLYAWDWFIADNLGGVTVELYRNNQGTVSGVVTNSLSTGIDGVQVTIGGRTATTDNSGHYTVAAIPWGTHIPAFTKSGYSFTLSLPSVTIGAGNTSVTVNAQGRYTADAIDSGFRPEPHGFAFDNFMSISPQSWDLFRRTFPDSEVEFTDGTHKSAAEQFFSSTYVSTGLGGNCRGFSHASLIYATGLTSTLETVEDDILAPPNSQAAYVHEMIERSPNDVTPGQSDVKDYIHIYQGRALSPKTVELGVNPKHSLQLIKDALADFGDNALDVIIRSDDPAECGHAGGCGHSMVPYRVEVVDGKTRIYVYDSNDPDAVDRFIEVDTTTASGSWAYLFDPYYGRTWTGAGENLTVDLAEHNFPACIDTAQPCNVTASAATGVAVSIVGVSGNTATHIVDSEGRRLTFGDGESYNEIPGAWLEVIPTGYRGKDSSPSPVIYFLPITGTYTLLVTARSSTTYAATAYAGEIAVTVSNVEAPAGRVDTVMIGSGLRQISLALGVEPLATGAGADASVNSYCFAFADDALNGASREFSVCSAGAASGLESFGIPPDSSSLTYMHTGTAAAYTMSVEQVGLGNGAQSATGVAWPNQSITYQPTPLHDPGAPDGMTWKVVHNVYMPAIYSGAVQQ